MQHSLCIFDPLNIVVTIRCGIFPLFRIVLNNKGTGDKNHAKGGQAIQIVSAPSLFNCI